MARTLDQIQRDIDALQREKESARKREVGKVIERIRVAIEAYKLTRQDLFGGSGRRAAKPARKGRGAAKGRKTVGRIKYRDGAGHEWTGHGRRPQWFIDALAAGKKPEDMAV